MNFKRILETVVMMTLCILIGCSTVGQRMGLPSSDAIVAASLEEMAPDAARVSRAIGSRLCGKTVPANVRLSAAANKALMSSQMIEPGFQLKTACLGHYAAKGAGSSSYQATGRIELHDSLNRSTAMAFDTTYDIQGAQTVINTVTIRPLFDTTPETVCFVIPAESAELKATRSTQNFASLYNYLGQKAIDPQTGMSVERKNYLVAVFFLNRMSPSAKTIAAVSDSPSGIQGYSKESRYIDYNGWRVGLVSGCMALQNPKTESSVYLKAVYTPGKEAGFFRTSKLVGLYTLAKKH